MSSSSQVVHNGSPSLSVFTYLGSVKEKDEGADKDIRTRIGKARSAFLTLKPVWRSLARKKERNIKIYLYMHNAKGNVAPII